MRLKEAVFLDYKPYNQDTYAWNCAHYEDNHIVSGFRWKSTTSLNPGTLFFKGWHLVFEDNFEANKIQGNWIYATYSSTPGSADIGVYESTYTPGKLTATIKQGLTLPSGSYPIYRYLSGEWALQGNGRIDRINSKKADINNHLILEGKDLNVTNPVFNTSTNLDKALQDLEDKIDVITGGGLTEATADNKYYQKVYLNRSSITPENISGKSLAEIIYMMRTAYPIPDPCYLIGYSGSSGFGELADILKQVISDIYGRTENVSHLTFVVNCPLGTSNYLAGGTTMTIIGNSGEYRWEFIVDNYGNNYTTLNTDLFRAPIVTGEKSYFKGVMESGGIVTGNGKVAFNRDGTYFQIPSNFRVITTDGGDDKINFQTNVNIEKELSVGNGRLLPNGSFVTSKIGTRNIEFNNATGTTGSKSITLNHNNGAFAGSIEWNREINGANSVAAMLSSLTEGLLYAGFKSKENTRLYNYATSQFVQEAATYLAREVDFMTVIVKLQEKVDEQDLRIKLLEAQMQAIIAGEKPMKTLPATLSNDVESNELVTARSMLANSKTELRNENYLNTKTKLVDQRDNLRKNLVAVNVLRSVPATTLNYKNVLKDVERELEALEMEHMKGDLNESK